MKKTLSTFILAVLAGISIGLGGNVYLALFTTNKIVGAILFTVGLFTICTHGFNLFTGKACYILDNKPSYLGTLVVIWLGNLLGTSLMAFLVRSTRLAASYVETAQKLCAGKSQDSYLSLFLLAVLCNILIYIAVEGYKNNPHELGKYLSLFFGVSVFILSGSEHSVADMYYYAVSGELTSLDSLARILTISLGNVAGGLLIPAGKKLSEKFAE